MRLRSLLLVFAAGLASLTLPNCQCAPNPTLPYSELADLQLSIEPNPLTGTTVYESTLGGTFNLDVNAQNYGAAAIDPFDITVYITDSNLFIEETATTMGTISAADGIDGRTSVELVPSRLLLGQEVTVPDSFGHGSHNIFVGANLNGSLFEEETTDNNVGSGFLRIDATTDLQALGVTTDLDTVPVGEDLTVSLTFTNNGEILARGYTVQFYFSRDEIWTEADDTLFHEVSYEDDVAPAEFVDTGQLVVPVDGTVVPNGDGFVFGRVMVTDFNNEIDLTNNVTSVPRNLRITSQADLILENSAISYNGNQIENIIAPGTDFDLGFDVTEVNGIDPAAGTSTAVWFSEQSILDGSNDEVLLGTIDTPSVNAGESSNVTPVTLSAPAGLPSGQGYLVLLADNDEEIFETVETNNRHFLNVLVDAELDLRGELLTVAPTTNLSLCQEFEFGVTLVNVSAIPYNGALEMNLALSVDEILDDTATDPLITDSAVTAAVNVNLAPMESLVVDTGLLQLSSSLDETPNYAYLLLDIDPGDLIAERDDTNNLVSNDQVGLFRTVAPTITQQPAGGTESWTSDVGTRAQWDAVPGMLDYEVQYILDDGMPDPVWTGEGTLLGWSTDTFADFSDLCEGTYLWRVRSRSAAGCEQDIWTNGTNFVVADIAPPSITQQPTGDVEGWTSSAADRAEWDPVVNATDYEVQYRLDTEPDWSNATTLAWSTDTFFNVTDLCDGTYDWRVRSRSGTSCEGDTWTTGTSLTVSPLTPPSGLSAPTGGAQPWSATAGNRFEWNTVAGQEYQFEYKRNYETVWNTNAWTTNGFYQPTGWLGGVWVWRVKTRTIGSVCESEVTDGANVNITPIVDLAIGKITLNQGVEIDIDVTPATNLGTASNPNPAYDAYTIAERAGIIRVFIDQNGGTIVDPVEVQVHRVVSGSVVATLTQTDTIPATWDQDNFGDSINFNMPASWAEEGTDFYVEINTATTPVVEGNMTNNRYPATGNQTFGFEEVQPLELTLKPIDPHWANVPSISAAYLDDLLSHLRQTKPIPDDGGSNSQNGMTFSQDPTLTYTSGNGPQTFSNGSGWSNLLVWLHGVNATENPSGFNKHYYYGLFDPGYNWGVLGLAYRPSNSAFPAPSGIGTSRNPSGGANMATTTFAHEVGHNQSLQHVADTTPGCGSPASPDTNYPFYNGGVNPRAHIGNPGWDILGSFGATSLKDSLGFRDLMSYCGGAVSWVSQFHWNKMFEWDASITPFNPFIANAPVGVMVSGLSRNPGEISIEHVLPSDDVAPSPDHGDYTMQFLDDAGRIVHETRFDLVEFSHVAGHGFHVAAPIAPNSFERIRVLHVGNWVSDERRVSVLNAMSQPPVKVTRSGSTIRVSTTYDHPDLWRMVRITEGEDRTVLDYRRNPQGDFTFSAPSFPLRVDVMHRQGLDSIMTTWNF